MQCARVVAHDTNRRELRCGGLRSIAGCGEQQVARHLVVPLSMADSPLSGDSSQGSTKAQEPLHGVEPGADDGKAEAPGARCNSYGNATVGRSV